MSGPTEYRYRDRDAQRDATWLIFVAVVLFAGSLITGLWAIFAFAHASWLETNDLPAFNSDWWGVVLLCIATVQGISSVLILFGARLGIWLGIAFALFSIAAHLSVISAYPIWSIAGIAADALIIYLLVAHSRRG